MVSDLVMFEEYLLFRNAADRARELAVRFEQQTGLSRSESGWAVLVPTDFESVNLPLVDGRPMLLEEYADRLEFELEVEAMEKESEDRSRADQEDYYFEEGGSSGYDSHDTPYGRFQAPRDQFGRTEPTGSGC